MPIDPLDLLSEMQRHEVEAALDDPVQRERFQLAALVQLRDSVAGLEERDRIAQRQCADVCRPTLDRRFARLERFRAWLIGIGVGFGGLAALLGAIWAIFGRGS